MKEHLREQPRKAYDTVAAEYGCRIPDTSFEAPLDVAMVDEFVSKAAERPASKVLDAGCGAGRMVTYLQSRSPSLEVAGIDLSAEMLTLARSAHPTVEFRQADLADTPFPDREFDGILAWYSIIHTEPDQIASTAAEFARILRTEGGGPTRLPGRCRGTPVGQAHSHDVELRAFLHRTDDVIATLINAGFELVAKLDRAPRASERHVQGFVLARRR